MHGSCSCRMHDKTWKEGNNFTVRTLQVLPQTNIDVVLKRSSYSYLLFSYTICLVPSHVDKFSQRPDYILQGFPDGQCKTNPQVIKCDFFTSKSAKEMRKSYQLIVLGLFCFIFLRKLPLAHIVETVTTGNV